MYPEEVLQKFGLDLIEPVRRLYTHDQISEICENNGCMDWCDCDDEKWHAIISKIEFTQLFVNIVELIDINNPYQVSPEFYETMEYHGFVSPPLTGNLLPSLALITVLD